MSAIPQMLSVAEARARLLERFQPVGTERVPLAEVLYFKAELKYVTLRTPSHSWIMDESLTGVRASRQFRRAELLQFTEQFRVVRKNFAVHRKQFIKCARRALVAGHQAGGRRFFGEACVTRRGLRLRLSHRRSVKSTLFIVRVRHYANPA